MFNKLLYSSETHVALVCLCKQQCAALFWSLDITFHLSESPLVAYWWCNVHYLWRAEFCFPVCEPLHLLLSTLHGNELWAIRGYLCNLVANAWVLWPMIICVVAVYDPFIGSGSRWDIPPGTRKRKSPRKLQNSCGVDIFDFSCGGDASWNEQGETAIRSDARSSLIGNKPGATNVTASGAAATQTEAAHLTCVRCCTILAVL